ncbi:hypothetical protein [Mesobacillus thioparans]|uniref:hypothetical protein n=1 Tax=Mesobacillus thioparans TaxID=370439 RepID=UPI0039F1217E
MRYFWRIAPFIKMIPVFTAESHLFKQAHFRFIGGVHNFIGDNRCFIGDFFILLAKITGLLAKINFYWRTGKYAPFFPIEISRQP